MSPGRSVDVRWFVDLRVEGFGVGNGARLKRVWGWEADGEVTVVRGSLLNRTSMIQLVMY